MEASPSGTPLRGLNLPLKDGCRVLSDPGIAYSDGSEKRLLELLDAATDISSTSDELLGSATNWPERYHLDPARAHVLRALHLDPGSSVLEVGAGCGALSRILGERCQLVDTIEPMQERAAVGRRRTRDLTSVEVFIGTIEDVPAVPTYDIVLIMGVLEYVGGGSADPGVYLDFLRRAAALLRPGGTLVLGIENRLGVKYLCGAPEDHSGRPFESVEGYDVNSPARTFSRRELEGFLHEVGLTPQALGLFPDYKLTRLVFSDTLLELQPNLAAHIPNFPSPDWAVDRRRVANEARVWANLVEAGLGTDTANSLLMLAHRGNGPSSLWSEDLLAVYYPSAGRRMVYTPETSVVVHGDQVVFTRRPVTDTAPDDADVHLSLRESSLQEGDDLLERMARTTTDEELALLLNIWIEALDRSLAEGILPSTDLLPHNAVLMPSGDISFVDAKWVLAGFGRSDILARAAHQTAWRLAGIASPTRWTATTFEGLVLHIGTFLGVAPDSGWLPEALDREARFQAQITVETPHDRQYSINLYGRIRSDLDAQLAQPLTALDGSGHAGAPDRPEDLAAEIARTSLLLATTEARAAEEVERAAAAESRLRAVERSEAVLRDEFDALHRTRTFRYSRAPRRVYSSLRRLFGRSRADRQL